ncbi:hypothetical protein [Bradyrhizobium guangzhouense]|uniref:3',5'-cyclic-nucleotide phosphodiesterase n=1 Tax=Bradyrhizobium guangzhouense TaxID=1325095 RepID=A0AAE6CAS6_9BRAD|nr:hypothetical protein [Bradyrhizobium guangzhouense]QAU49088.1 hypothetical protein XH91_29505 [Bradyrhizobium guangzhouense]RXH10273.1 hypothetical protein EAS56_23730 [Bradyrhizobium guangzhouense]
MPVSRVTTSKATKSMAAAALGVALAVLVQPGTSLAYTPEQQQACSPDAMRLCGEFVPNVDAITACMVQKKAQLSPQCAVFFRRGPEPVAGQPTNIKPVVAKKAKPKAKKKKTDDG